MIITITGKPCSGKGTLSKEFCKLYNFEYMCTGDMFRTYAKKIGYDNVLEFQEQSSLVKKADEYVDSQIVKIGKTKSNKNIVIDSRLAWHFIPTSFKVFVDVDIETAGKRLIEANRDTEKTTSLKNAMKQLKSRWTIENQRYLELYGTNNLDLTNYDLVIDSSNKTPKELAEIVYIAYQDFMKKN